MSAFRHYGVSYLEFKRIDMDRVLTSFLMRVHHGGRPGKLGRRFSLNSDNFVQEFLDPAHAERFQGFAEHQDMARRWIETQLLDMVNRGKPGQAVAGLRPLHGMTYKFRNAAHSRPYGADAQLYEMLRHARHDRGRTALEALGAFFFTGLEPALGTPLAGADLDVETQAVLHLNSQVKPDTPLTVKDWYSAPPLCVGQCDLLADDVLRLLSLHELLPRIVMVEHLKILFAFHLALGQLKTMKLLPAIVGRQRPDPAGGPDNCPLGAGHGHDRTAPCPFAVGLFVDAAGDPASTAARLAEHSAQVWLRRIPSFVRAGYVVRKLDEFGRRLLSTGELPKLAHGHLTVPEVLRLAGPEYRDRRERFFGSRMDAVLDDTPADRQPESVRPEMAALPVAGINELPRPLAGMVFHYSETTDYAPEFTTMTAPNSDEAQLAALCGQYGAEPAALSDVVLLTTADTVEERRSDYPGLDVRPIAFGSCELQAAHWRFLMGAVGNQSIYIRQLGRIMKASRGNPTLEAIRAVVQDSSMSEALKELALLPLEFAADYIDDGVTLAQLVRPGRLIIVLHKFVSPAWLKHLQKANAALAGLSPEKMAGLRAGEAFVWSSRATDDAFTQGAVKVRCRPRVTRHGGATRTAVNTR